MCTKWGSNHCLPLKRLSSCCCYVCDLFLYLDDIHQHDLSKDVVAKGSEASVEGYCLEFHLVHIFFFYLRRSMSQDQNVGIDRKVLPQGISMRNMKVLSLSVQKLMLRLSFFKSRSKVNVKVMRSKLFVQRKRSRFSFLWTDRRTDRHTDGQTW